MAAALAARSNEYIVKHNTSTFEGLERGSKWLWDEVKRLRGSEDARSVAAGGISCDSLNTHYQTISTDTGYREPHHKLTVNCANPVLIMEYHVCRALDSIRGSSVGPDDIPSWLLSTMAHLLSTPIAFLFQCSLQSSYVPPQWRSS